VISVDFPDMCSNSEVTIIFFMKEGIIDTEDDER